MVVEPAWREKRFPIMTGGGGRQRQEFQIEDNERFRGAFIIGVRQGVKIVKTYGKAGTVVKDILIPHLQFSYLGSGEVKEHKENHQSATREVGCDLEVVYYTEFSKFTIIFFVFATYNAL